MLSGFWDNVTAANVCSQYDGDTPPPACASLNEEKAKYMDGKGQGTNSKE